MRYGLYKYTVMAPSTQHAILQFYFSYFWFGYSKLGVRDMQSMEGADGALEIG